MWLNNQVANGKETAAENKSKKYSDFIAFTCSNAYSCKYLIRETHITLARVLRADRKATLTQVTTRYNQRWAVTR